MWSIASLPKANLLLSKEQIIKSFLNITMPVLDAAACPASFCKNKNYTGSSGGSTIPAYGQCGGAGGECAGYYCADKPFPGYKCVSGWTCQRQHRWYYQCLPATLPVSTTGCDFSAFGEPLATMMSGLGMICNLKAGIMQFALNPLAVPKLVDPSAMLNIFSGGSRGNLGLTHAQSGVFTPPIATLPRLLGLADTQHHQHLALHAAVHICLVHWPQDFCAGKAASFY